MSIMMILDVAVGLVLGMGIWMVVCFKLMATDWFIDQTMKVTKKITKKTLELETELNEIFTEN